MKIYELSPRIDASTPVWPGDTPFSTRPIQRLADGDPVNLATLTTTPHLGSHADAPLHTEADGGDVADQPLAPYLGPCRVVAVAPGPRGVPPALVEPFHLGGVDPADPPRLLLKTRSAGDRDRFPESFTALSPALAELLVESGALLVGLDTPSVDPFDSKTLDAHHILFQGGVANLEGLLLDEVPEGVYELIALPLRLAGVDASPVRAVLREMAPAR